jgi:DNA-binding NtrC family response regulator
MSASRFCLTRDPGLSRSLTDRFCSNGDTIESVSDVGTACAKTRGLPCSTVFVDFRQAAQVASLELFFEPLSRGELGRVDMIATTDGVLPLSTAAFADLYSVKTLRLPLQTAECKEIAHFLSSGGRINGHRCTPECRTLSGGPLSITTYEPRMFKTIDLLERVASKDVPLLLVGETGTGKTTLAQIIHNQSPRRDEPFHNVACGALPPTLIESDLFGHARGAFTGADRHKIGRFQAARKGTLLLDEIDVLGPNEQVKLLRIIETGQYEPVGMTETRKSQARLIAASNVDLEAVVESRRFRSDLYYRLNVLQFRLLPLRERVADIVPMAVIFIEECCRQHGIPICSVSRDFLDCLKRFSWPGNIRELKNHLQRAVLLNQDGGLSPRDLTEAVREAPQNAPWLPNRV